MMKLLEPGIGMKPRAAAGGFALMILRVSSLAFLAVLTSASAAAQHNCPEGFNYAGTLRGTGSFVGDFNERRQLLLPEDATIDTSFQQAKVRAAQGNSSARSNMLPRDIPKGILIIPYGATDLEKGWAVSDPVLTTLHDSTGASRYQFGMKLFCTVGTSPATRQFGGCSVEVDVCYKQKK